MLLRVLSVPRVSTQVRNDLMILVPLSSVVLVTRLYLPVNEETHVSELRVAVSSWSCHASLEWFLLLDHAYKAVVR